jgi:hypothetical protein
VLAAFLGFNCWHGLRQARALLALENAQHHPDMACPACGTAPPIGSFWTCGKCGTAFDTFHSHGACPSCGAQFATTACPACGVLSSLDQWTPSAAVPPGS